MTGGSGEEPRRAGGPVPGLPGMGRMLGAKSLEEGRRLGFHDVPCEAAGGRRIVLNELALDAETSWGAVWDSDFGLWSPRAREPRKPPPHSIFDCGLVLIGSRVAEMRRRGHSAY